MRSDPLEASVISNFIIEDQNSFRQKHPQAHMFVQQFLDTTSIQKVYVVDNAFATNANMHLYCASTSLSAEVAQLFDAVACVKIKKVNRFYGKLTRFLHQSGRIMLDE